MRDIFFLEGKRKEINSRPLWKRECNSEGRDKLKSNELNYFIGFQNKIKYTRKYYAHCRTYFTCFGSEKSTMLKHLGGNVSAKVLNCVLVL